MLLGLLFFALQVSVDNYTEWIQLVAQLTIDSLNSWQWAKDSVYYLLGLWSRCGFRVLFVIGFKVCDMLPWGLVGA
jgi:hypothetical protein